jgi:hypothetical protein
MLTANAEILTAWGTLPELARYCSNKHSSSAIARTRGCCDVKTEQPRCAVQGEANTCEKPYAWDIFRQLSWAKYHQQGKRVYECSHLLVLMRTQYRVRPAPRPDKRCDQGCDLVFIPSAT